MRATLLAGVFCLISFSANAEDDFNTTTGLLASYDKADPAKKSNIETMLVFAAEGTGYANATLIRDRKEQPLYCQPGNLDLTGSQLVQILRQQIKERPYYAAIPPADTLLDALQNTFPCPSK
jgi:hypothetical protein